MSLFETESFEMPKAHYIDPFSLFGPETILDTFKGSAELDDDEIIRFLSEHYGDNYLNELCAENSEPPSEAEVNP